MGCEPRARGVRGVKPIAIGPGGLEAVVDRLLARTGASRATVRFARPDGTAELVAEALAPGVPSMSSHAVPGIADAPTYRYLAERHEILVQCDTRSAAVAPPTSLVDHFKVLAQVLAPVVVTGTMVATVSLHQQGTTRDWDGADIDAVADASAEVAKILAGSPA